MKSPKQEIVDRLHGYVNRYNGNTKNGVKLKSLEKITEREARYITNAFETLEMIAIDKGMRL